MGLGRARRAGDSGRLKALVFAAALALAAVFAIGCGAESHPNEPRPQSPTRVSVTISENGVIVQPTTIAVGPEKTQQIPQNQDHAQPVRKTKEPLAVVFVAANQTEAETHLEVDGPTKVKSGPLHPNSPGTTQANLPTGTYTITAAGVPGAKPAKLVVGPVRTSSQNDVLLP
jgi:hypothetical protein